MLTAFKINSNFLENNSKVCLPEFLKNKKSGGSLSREKNLVINLSGINHTGVSHRLCQILLTYLVHMATARFPNSGFLPIHMNKLCCICIT